jgi:putative lipoic acid-binding regulatory protein
VSDEQDTPPANPSGEELLKFPTDYPIKVVGRPSAEFRARIHAIVLKHVPNVETDRITERLSENGNFLSISYMIVAESREQVVALAKDLAAADGVLMVI